MNEFKNHCISVCLLTYLFLLNNYFTVKLKYEITNFIEIELQYFFFFVITDFSLSYVKVFLFFTLDFYFVIQYLAVVHVKTITVFCITLIFKIHLFFVLMKKPIVKTPDDKDLKIPYVSVKGSKIINFRCIKDRSQFENTMDFCRPELSSDQLASVLSYLLMEILGFPFCICFRQANVLCYWSEKTHIF